MEEIDKGVDRLGDLDLDKKFEELPKKRELRASAVPTTEEELNSLVLRETASGSRKTPTSNDAKTFSPKNKAPIIQTHSALGILLSALPQTDFAIEFVTQEKFKKFVTKTKIPIHYRPVYGFTPWSILI